MTRLRLPPGLNLVDGIYSVVGRADGGSIGIRDAARLRDCTLDWLALRELLGVEIECARHPGQWWPTRGKQIPVHDVQNWRCPNCAWAFRQAVARTPHRPPF